MLSYKPFFETLLRMGHTEYYLIFKQGLSANAIHRMKRGEAITTKTLDSLCEILGCGVGYVIEYVSEERRDWPPPRDSSLAMRPKG